jgi:hypothetical protein
MWGLLSSLSFNLIPLVDLVDVLPFVGVSCSVAYHLVL